MHRKENERERLLSYIKGAKEGREARHLEREAMQDQFLADALDGYDDTDDPEAEIRLRRMEKQVELHGTQTHRFMGRVAAAINQPQPLYTAMCEAYAPPQEQPHEQPRPRPEPRPEPRPKRRRHYAVWLSAAAVIAGVSTLSYQIGRHNGEKMTATAFSTHIESAPERMQRAAELRSMRSAATHIGTQPQPATGYGEYYRHIYEKLGGGEDRNGIVVLNFSIDAQGRPSDFEVVESSSPELAREIISIIQSGPDWNNAGEVKAFTVVAAE